VVKYISKLGRGQACGFFPFLTSKLLGKTEARQDFFNVLNEVEAEPIALTITDRGKKVAVIIGIKQYEIMLGMIQKHMESAGDDPLAGLFASVGDLDQDAQKINAIFQNSVTRTAGELQ